MLPLVLQELKAQGVHFIVAPYEADAQMAYLARRNDVQLVITEDSDLLAYGCPRCDNQYPAGQTSTTVAHMKYDAVILLRMSDGGTSGLPRAHT
jgi:5'-3' exonuclease